MIPGGSEGMCDPAAVLRRSLTFRSRPRPQGAPHAYSEAGHSLLRAAACLYRGGGSGRRTDVR